MNLRRFSRCTRFQKSSRPARKSIPPAGSQGTRNRRALRDFVADRTVSAEQLFRRRGIGRLLVEAVIGGARRFRPREVIALTFAPEFFSALGFAETPKSEVMHKLYTGCINCTKHANPYTCPEIAMRRRMEY